MYGVDTDQGLFLMEQLNWDEYGAASGTPILPFYLPQILSAGAFIPVPIIAILKTRRYVFGTMQDKRFSSCEAEFLADAGSQITTVAEVFNPDVTYTLDVFGSESTEDSVRRNGIRKIGSGIQFIYTSSNLRPSIRSSSAYATVQKPTNNSKQ